MNRFSAIYTTDDLPLLTADPNCEAVSSVFAAQIAEWFLVPCGIDPPESWSDYATWVQFIDNTQAGGSRRIVGTGGIAEPTEIETSLPRRTGRRISLRSYTATLSTIQATNATYNLATRFQKGHIGFRFWACTVAGRIIGGSKGIKPELISAAVVYGDARGDVESVTFRIEWDALTDPMRGDVIQPPTITNPDVGIRAWGDTEDTLWGTDLDNLWAF